MKKIVAIILGLFLVLGFAGCNSDGSDIKIDMDEFISNPTKLVIAGTTLSWDEVENAEGYIVYANDEEVDKVKTNSFDFSSLSEELIIFQVRTRAPRGMQDSALSAKLAFVANKAEEIAAVNQTFVANGMIMDEGFSEELVNKGMVSGDIEGLVEKLSGFSENMESAETFDDFIVIIRDLVDEAENIEALISALVKVELVEYLQEEIYTLEAEKYGWVERGDSDYYGFYTETEIQDKIDALQLQIDAFEDLIEQIEDDPDAIVLAITSTIEYFISVEEMISGDLVALIDGLDVDGTDNMNVTEYVDIKEEIVYILKETMPTLEEMVLVMDVMDLVASLSGTSLSYSTTVDNFKGKTAAQSLYSLEAFINFLDTMDENFFEEVKTIGNDDDLEYDMKNAELIILVVEYFDKFYDNNEDLFDTINAVFTDEEQEALFDEYKLAMGQLEGSEFESVSSIMTSLNFQQLIDLQIIFGDSFGEILDAFVASDGEIVRQAMLYSNFTYYEDRDSPTGTMFSNVSEYEEAKEITSYRLLKEMIVMINAFVQSLDADELNEITSFLLDSVFEGIISEIDDLADFSYDDSLFTQAEALAAKNIVSNALELANEDILAFVQALLVFLIDEDIWEEYEAVIENVYDYYVGEYGEDFRGVYSFEYSDDEYDSNAKLIFVADLYDEFMTNNNRDTLDDILEVVFDALRSEDLSVMYNYEPATITTMETAIDTVLDLLSSNFNDIKDLDYTDLDSDDLELIESFKGSIISTFLEVNQVE